jgi:hypothetical protein
MSMGKEALILGQHLHNMFLANKPLERFLFKF